MWEFVWQIHANIYMCSISRYTGENQQFFMRLECFQIVIDLAQMLQVLKACNKKL